VVLGFMARVFTDLKVTKCWISSTCAMRDIGFNKKINAAFKREREDQCQN